LKKFKKVFNQTNTDAMDYASRYGHLEIVKYLHSIGKDSSTHAMDLASRYGHLEIVKYLHEIGQVAMDI
jgi:ankyrin repeat protein